MTRALANFEDGPEQDREPFEQAAERGEGAKREPAKERLRQNAQDEKINGERDYERNEKAESAESDNQQLRQEEQTENVGKVRDQQHGDEQALRPFRQAVEPQSRRAVLLHLVTETNWIDRE